MEGSPAGHTAGGEARASARAPPRANPGAVATEVTPDGDGAPAWAAWAAARPSVARRSCAWRGRLRSGSRPLPRRRNAPASRCPWKLHPRAPEFHRALLVSSVRRGVTAREQDGGEGARLPTDALVLVRGANIVGVEQVGARGVRASHRSLRDDYTAAPPSSTSQGSWCPARRGSAVSPSLARSSHREWRVGMVADLRRLPLCEPFLAAASQRGQFAVHVVAPRA